MINCYQHVKTSIETLDANENFKLYLTYYEAGKKPLLLGMNLSYQNLYTTPSTQVCNHFRSVFRKFGNEFLRKIAPNDYFSIEERTVEKIVYKSLLCKFIKNQKVYIDVVEAHAMTQAWDQLMNKYDLSRLFSSRESITITRAPNGLLQYSSEVDKQLSNKIIPEEMEQFLEKIIDTEPI